MERESWGEQMEKIVEPKIFTLDVASRSIVELENLPKDVSPAEVSAFCLFTMSLASYRCFITGNLDARR